MTKQKAIYLLNNLRAFAEEDDNPAIDMAIEALQDDWIPTSERLPEVITKATINKVKALEDIALWLRDEVMDEENWELNAVANGEIICRKLVKCGLLEVKDGEYHYVGQYYRPTVSIIAENRRERYKR